MCCFCAVAFRIALALLFSHGARSKQEGRGELRERRTGCTLTQKYMRIHRSELMVMIVTIITKLQLLLTLEIYAC